MNHSLPWLACLAALCFVAADSTKPPLDPSQWRKLADSPASEIPSILAKINDSNPLANNWYRSAIDRIAERTLAADKKLPVAELERFLNDRQHNVRARRLAYELIIAADLAVKDRLLPTLLDDPSVEIRRDAVAKVLDDADGFSKTDKAAAGDAYEKALKAARDEDQIKLASEKLKELGRPFDLPRHFGFVMQWKLIGPFDNVGKKGFAVAYPPEQKLDFTAELPGKSGPVKWIDHTTTDDYGHVDLNKAIGKNMGAVAYAATDFESDANREIEIRYGTDCATKLWLNGEPLLQAEVYHANVALDQYIARGKLKAGKNTILIKVCQNEQTEDWAQDWKFQLRVCDAAGTAVLATNRPATNKQAQVSR